MASSLSVIVFSKIKTAIFCHSREGGKPSWYGNKMKKILKKNKAQYFFLCSYANKHRSGEWMVSRLRGNDNVTDYALLKRPIRD
jgi:hypothetical protein